MFVSLAEAWLFDGSCLLVLVFILGFPLLIDSDAQPQKSSGFFVYSFVVIASPHPQIGAYHS